MPPNRKPQHATVEDLGRRLASLREAAGYSQAQLADAIGVTRRTISYYETEGESPPAHLLIALANTLHVSIDELLGLKPIKDAAKGRPHGNSRIMRRLKQLEKLPRPDQDALLRTIDAFLHKAS